MEKEQSELAKIVAKRLAETRGDLSGTRAAYKAEIPPQLWNRYERAASLPGADALQKICSAFGVSADWLLGLSEVKLRSEVAAQRKANLDAVIEKQAAALERFSRMLDEQLPKP